MFESFQEANPDITLLIPYICCLTAYSGKEQRDLALGAEMDEFCLKPFSSDNLESLLFKTRVLKIN